MRVLYSARYQIDIGLHVFPSEKYRLVRDRLLESRVVGPSDVSEPRPATWAELGLVHTDAYLRKLREGTLTPEDLAELELPWSLEMVEAFRLMVGGTIEAGVWACSQGMACHLGGGLHHAFPGHGEGFCPLNDVAVAVRVLQARDIARHAVVDLDVHHGNGTAFIFEADPRVFTFSMHQQHNYPMWKPAGSLDVGLADGAGDARFLSELERALPKVLAHHPDLVFYLAGADPFEGDQLGGLKLTRDGLRQRDRMVIEAIRGAGIPLVITLAGGYAQRVQDTVAIHSATIEEAVRAASARMPS
jgi:acetoin utilization deacetylase AcuC-like enzyme